MSKRGLHPLMVVLLALLMAVPGLADPGTTPPSGFGESRGPAPFSEEQPLWTDSLDDLSHVYVPEGGLVNVEVAGGEAHLVAGATEGWIASTVITCPPGYRYDIVILEADLPGASQIQISILNASKESSEVGFANETIPSHVRVNGTDHRVYDISPGFYPQIRIQVNLLASGPDQSRLLSWALHYVELDEWCDDFFSSGKMSSFRGLNFTEGALEVNLTRMTKPPSPEYEAYPVIALPDTNYKVRFLYPNATHTGYLDFTDLTANGPYGGGTFGDLNEDGFIDFVIAEHGADRARIYWGSSSGIYSESNILDLSVQEIYSVGIGDFNGDRWKDLAMGYYDDGPPSSIGKVVFLNNCDGTFDSTADLSLSGQDGPILVGDVNADGYDDIVCKWEVYFGTPLGPGTSPDITLSVASYVDDIQDINFDGYSDLLISRQSSLRVCLGSSNWYDGKEDLWIQNLPFLVSKCRAGDVNGDGYMDIVIHGYEAGNQHNFSLGVLEGDEEGWDGSRYHTFFTEIGDSSTIEIADIDGDGCDDILYFSRASSTNRLRIFLGGSSWPSGQPAITRTSSGYAYMIAVAIPSVERSGKHFMGAFTTTEIELPMEKKWDIIHIDGIFPQNTSMMLSVLDGTGKEITGYKNLADSDVDLSALDTTHYRTIKVKVTLMSEFNWTSPVLDRLTVKWMDRRCWRDQFYGALKTERILNMGVANGQLQPTPIGGEGPQLVFPSLRGDEGYNTSTPAFLDAGGADYLSWEPMMYDTVGVAAADMADVNGDGLLDTAFAVHGNADHIFSGSSPLFLSSPVGWDEVPDYRFDTVGAIDVLLRDLNADGYMDIVFAQEQDGTTYRINSTLFWGSESGWNSTPDVEFQTSGASDVEAGDIDNDRRLDLVFACYRDDASTATDSMVFLQNGNGYCGTVPSYKLATRGARAVAIGDIDRDGRSDLVFANSIQGGITEIDSFVYWGRDGGGFEATPTNVRTVGARDVKLDDVDGDGDLDLVFANQVSNTGQHGVDSYVYLGSGTKTLPSSPSVRLPTIGAVSVAVADLDGRGRKDLVFACQYDGARYNISSCVYLGGTSAWPSTPSIELPTQGASDVVVAHIIKVGQGGYLSKAIQPEDIKDTNGFHTLKYTARLGPELTGSVQLVDATTRQMLAETTLENGPHEWLVQGLLWLKDHPSVRVMVSVMGLDKTGEFALDDLWLNWTKRARQPPQVLDAQISPASLHRLQAGALTINVSDEYDPAWELRPLVEHRLNGSTGPWGIGMLSLPTFSDGSWRVSVMPKADVLVGTYDVRVEVRDSDFNTSGIIVFPNAFKVLNNVPSAPEVRIEPERAMTTSTIQVVVTRAATDVESGALMYRYQWYCGGILQENVTSNMVLSNLTSKGQNWSVEVRAFDGLDEGSAATAWRVIENAPPVIKTAMANPELMEDTVDDQWLNLASAFEDPDGDVMTWTVSPSPKHITVTIDPVTGVVTMRPAADWFGDEAVTFVASDGELTASQTVLVTVTSVNDIPWFATVNGEPITADPVAFHIMQGETLTIVPGAVDVEGDALMFSVNTSSVQLDEGTGAITFQAGNEAVGTLRFALTMWDTASPSVKVRLNLTIVVENKNDPMDAPKITAPQSGARFKVDQLLSLVGSCTDPDTVYGQALNYSWYANGTLLGYGPSRTVNFTAPGTYIINLTVSDGEFRRGAEVTIIIEAKEIPTPPPPPPTDGDGEEEGTSYGLIVGVIVVIAVAMLVAFLLVTRRRAARQEAADEAEEKKEAFKHMAAEVGATAAQMEREVAEAKAAKPAEPTKVIVETRGPDGQVVVATTGVPEQTLAVQPKETEAPSADVAKLFKEMEAKEPHVSAEEAEALHLESQKRKYQTAIGRLPYGIPAAELKGREWTWLAAALATGQKKDTPDGRELTLIEGRWYFSDVKDASTFLMEHEARPKAEPAKAASAKPAVAMTERATLLAKLDERYILGEISEEKYEELKRKLEGAG